jgi:hypothetical protein
LDKAGVKQANQKLKQAIQFSPRILASQETQRLILKLLMVQLLPTKTAAHFIQYLSRKLPMVPVPDEKFSQTKL